MNLNNSFEIRIKRLERLNMGLIVLTGILLIILLIGMQESANDAQQTVQASSFELVDSNGKLIAELAYKDGGPGLFLKDGRGEDRVAALYSEDQGGFFVMDSSGHTRIGAALFSHGGAGYALHGEGMKGAAVLYYKRTGTLSFYGSDGEVIMKLPEKPEQK